MYIPMLKICPPPSFHAPTRNHDLKNFYTTLKMFQHTLQLSWPIGFLKKILNFFLYSYVKNCPLKFKNSNLQCCPTLSPWMMIWINLNPHYLRMFSHKFQLLLPNGFGGDCFIYQKCLNNSKVSLLLRSCGPLFEQDPIMHCTNFGWNWPSGFGKENFNIKIYEKFTTTTTTPTTDNEQILIRKTELWLWLRWAKQVPHK